MYIPHKSFNLQQVRPSCPCHSEKTIVDQDLTIYLDAIVTSNSWWNITNIFDRNGLVDFMMSFFWVHKFGTFKLMQNENVIFAKSRFFPLLCLEFSNCLSYLILLYTNSCNDWKIIWPLCTYIQICIWHSSGNPFFNCTKVCKYSIPHVNWFTIGKT